MDYYEALYCLKDYYLGKNWYIGDPITNYQANKIIVDEIRRKFPKDTFSKMLLLNIIVLILNAFMIFFKLC